MSERFSTFSSSSIWKLTTRAKNGVDWGAPAVKYIKQVQYEIDLGRAINKETTAKPTSWGTFIEKRAFNLLGLDYEYVSTDRLVHPTIPHFSGMPDLKKINTVADCKCPYNLEVFCDKVIALEHSLERYKKEFPDDYYQHISNAILLEANGFPVTNFEAILYVPYISELVEIREEANNYDGNQNDVAFLNWAFDEQLPYLIEGGKYKNLNIFNYAIPSDDKDFIIDCVTRAGKLLITE